MALEDHGPRLPRRRVEKLAAAVTNLEADELAAADIDELHLLVYGNDLERYRTAQFVRMRAARRRKADSGGYAYGSPPFGWRAEGKQLVPEPSEQDTLRRVHELHAYKLSTRKIGEVLLADGRRPKRGRQWHSTTISRMLRQEPLMPHTCRACNGVGTEWRLYKPQPPP